VIVEVVFLRGDGIERKVINITPPSFEMRWYIKAYKLYKTMYMRWLAIDSALDWIVLPRENPKGRGFVLGRVRDRVRVVVFALGSRVPKSTVPSTTTTTTLFLLGMDTISPLASYARGDGDGTYLLSCCLLPLPLIFLLPPQPPPPPPLL